MSSDEDWISSSSESYAIPAISTDYAKGIIDVIGSNRAIDNPLKIDEHTVTYARETFTIKASVLMRSGSRECHLDFFESSVGNTPPFGEDPLNELAFSGAHLEHPPVEETKAEYVTTMAARLNPSRPAVDLGVSAAELIGAPVKLVGTLGSVLKSRGRKPLRGINLPTTWNDPGTDYLRLQFGLMPIIRDAQKLLQLTNEIDKKIEKIRRLKEHGYLRSSSKKFPKVYTSTISENFRDGVGGLWNVTSVRTTKRWCTLYYTAITDNLPETDAETRRMANSILYGTKLDGSTLWNVMPWSWMIDWFSNFGEYIESQRNTIGAKLSKSIVMETTEYETVTRCVVPPPLSSKLEYQFPYLASLEKLEGGSYTLLDSSMQYRCSDQIVRSTKKTREEVRPIAETDLVLSNLLDSGFRSSIAAALTLKSVSKSR